MQEFRSRGEGTLRVLRFALYGLLTAAFASAALGVQAQVVVFLATGLTAGVAVGASLMIRRPRHREPWIAFAVMATGWVAATLAGVIDANQMSGVGHYPNAGDAANALAGASGVLGLLMVGQARDDGKDPTHFIDALVVSFAIGLAVWTFTTVPYLLDPTAPRSQQIGACIFTATDLAWVTAVLRATMGPGRWDPAFRRVFIAVSVYLIGDLSIGLSHAGLVFPGQGALFNLSPTLCVALLALAALHPRVNDLTRAASADTGHLTLRRLFVLSLSIVSPVGLVALYARNEQFLAYAAWLLPLWTVMALLLMLRFLGLVRSRERTVAAEHIASRVVTAYAAEQARSAIYRRAAGAAHELARLRTPLVRASVVIHDGERGEVCATTGHGEPPAMSMDWTVVRDLYEDENRDRRSQRVPDVNGYRQYRVGVPVLINGDVVASLVVTATRFVDAFTVDRLMSLATDLALVLETVSLTEDLNRQASEQRFRTLVESSQDLFLVVDERNVLVFASPAAERALGAGPGLPLLDLVSHDDHAAALGALAHARQAGTSQLTTFRSRDGGSIYEAWLNDLRHETEVQGVVVNARDITKRRAAEAERDRNQARFAALVTHASDVVGVINREGVLEYISPSSSALFSRTPEELVGINLSRVMHRDDAAVFRAMLDSLDRDDENTSNIELRVRHPETRYKTLEVTVTDLRHDPAVNGIILNAHDVSGRKQLEESLRHRVLHDSLTGIANRVLYRERVAAALGRRGLTINAALFIDLDEFKSVNDSLGHDAGDQLLQEIAARLQRTLRSSDTPARFGGDEFAVLLEGLDAPDSAVTVAEQLISEISRPVLINGIEVRVGASIGVAVAHGAADVETFLRNADVAMYQAKRLGKGCVQVCDPAMEREARDRLDFRAELAHALERRQFELHYQPVFAVGTRTLAGFEALLRWHHPTRGMVSPALFVPLLEEFGHIGDIGTWVFTEAARQLRTWQDQYPGRELVMNVNVSPRQLTRASVVDELCAAVDAAKIERRNFVLELTETSTVDDEAARDRLQRLREAGFGIAADDFGSGFASYASLQNLAFTVVKLDRSLLLGLGHTDGRAEAQMQSIVDMARATGLEIVAEGIETEEQFAAVAAIGCDLAQGYLLGKPAPASNADAWFEAELVAD